MKHHPMNAFRSINSHGREIREFAPRVLSMRLADGAGNSWCANCIPVGNRVQTGDSCRVSFNLTHIPCYFQRRIGQTALLRKRAALSISR